MVLERGIYGAPPGADFPAALVAALSEWAETRPPEALARVTVFVNTRRMQRRIRALFDAGPARLLPRLRLVTDIGSDPGFGGPGPAISPIRRRLELAKLVRALLKAAPDLAPESAVFDLTDSLIRLMDEMQGEGVGIDAIRDLDIAQASDHWARAQEFLSLLGDFLAAGGDAAPDPEARLRLATLRLIARWQAAPPADPVIIAGSTGSRGTTALLMAAIADLPAGMVILPGFDFDLPADVWAHLAATPSAEDHPQFRFARFMQMRGLGPGDIRPLPGAASPDAARNRLLSLGLRPAPVTDAWLRDGPALDDLPTACAGMTLIEAPSPRLEAATIALAMREAVEERRSVALVTPDRMLTRRVTALLGRWGIVPDDSAGEPLGLTPPGRFLRMVARLFLEPPGGGALLALLKHPLTQAGEDRGEHLRIAREFELWVRSNGVAFADAQALNRWVAETNPSPRTEAFAAWAGWLSRILPDPAPGNRPLSWRVGALVDVAEALSKGRSGTPAPALWAGDPGQRAQALVQELSREAPAGDDLSAAAFEALLRLLLDRDESRSPTIPHPGVMIWGTLEARVQGADLVILGGLNEGTWPEQPPADPWLNRTMRAEAGLLLPERRIGLSAHDFQQAAAGPKVIFARARKEADAEPVPSRWLNRLTNLLVGLPETGGQAALDAMRERGKRWLDLAAAMETPERVPPAARPAPRPPVEARPTSISVTAVQRLIRDPYAIYARRVLGLRPAGTLAPAPDAPLRGQVLHEILDRFVAGEARQPSADPGATLLAIAGEVLNRRVPWPVARRLWHARLARVADWFIQAESRRAETERFLTSEVEGTLHLSEVGVRLTATADRIDQLQSGALAILDYKTGRVPTKKEIEHFDKQLLLEALIAEAGGFTGIEAAPVARIVHIGLGSSPKIAEHALEDNGDVRFSTASVRAGLVRLLAAYAGRDRGYAARRAMQKVGFEGDYDHLARYGEWDETQMPVPGDVG